jgi:hypothetical protein
MAHSVRTIIAVILITELWVINLHSTISAEIIGDNEELVTFEEFNKQPEGENALYLNPSLIAKKND